MCTSNNTSSSLSKSQSDNWVFARSTSGVASPSGLVVGLRGAGLLTSRGCSARPCARCFSAFFIFRCTLSERRGFPVPRPTGLLTARVLGNSGSAPTQVSIWVRAVYLSLLIHPCQSSPGTARLVSHWLVSAEPRTLAATCPLGHSLVFPHVRRKACISLTRYCSWFTI